MKEPSAPTQDRYLVRWDSVAGKRYRILRSTNLFNGFAAIQAGITGAPPFNVITDLPPQSPTLLYGVGLEP